MNTPSFRLALLLLAPAMLLAQPRHEAMDYGPFLSSSFENARGQSTLNGKGSVSNKGVAVRHGKREACSLFDTETLRMAGGWTGGWVRLRGVTFDGDHGPNPGPAQGADIFYETNPGPGWSQDGAFADTRQPPSGGAAYAKVPLGPIPASVAKYRGLYLNGEQVVFWYSVGQAEVLELGAVEESAGRKVMTRTFEVITGSLDAAVRLADLPTGGRMELRDGQAHIYAGKGEHVVVVAVQGADAAGLAIRDNTLSLRPGKAGTFKVTYAKAPAAELSAAAKSATGSAAPIALSPLTKGGPARWTETVELEGTLGEAEQQKALERLRKASNPSPERIRELEAAPYLVDTIPVPEKNPYNSWMRVGAIDFLEGNRLVFSTWSGDVWVSSPIDATLAKVSWRRFATGLFHGLGLKVIKGKVHVLGRDQITRLSDLNGDGEADLYENFNNDVQITPNFHEFAFDLQVDSHGNLYYVKGGPVNPGGRGWGPLSPHHGAIFRLPPDGSRLDVIATGIRAPNGMGVGPNGEISSGDNQGTWAPVDYISILPEPGHAIRSPHFVMVPDLSHRSPAPDKETPKPLCWIPYDVDNSNGGQAWVTSDQWGPLKGRMLYTSYGKSSLFLVLQERVGDVQQGGVVKLPLRFGSGIMRPRFNPHDGQLYIGGLKGWQTNAARDGAIHRVRFNGKSVTLPVTLGVTDAGITVGFTGALDAASASDLQNYALEQNNLLWSADYGSPELKLDAKDAKDPKGRGTTPVAIKSVKLAPDRKSVFLEVPGLKPVMVSRIKLNLKAEDGSRVPDEICHTINVVPPAAQAGKDYVSILSPSAPAGGASGTPSWILVVGLVVVAAVLWRLFRLRFGCCGCGSCSDKK
ncbi:MAG: DUF6797 domain-containing protein [Opitutia bacterium]